MHYIVCAAWNSVDKTKITYASILEKTTGPFKFILVNNGSDDGTKEWMDSITPPENVTFIHAKENGGCGIGRNIGLRAVGPDATYITLIDNDIVATHRWDTDMIAFMEARKEFGLCGPCTNYAGTPQLIPKPHPKTMEEIEVFADKWRREHNHKYTPVPGSLVVIGFCMMIRKAAFDQIGLFDEQFKLYGCEDNDYCNRMKKAGWKLAYWRGNYVHHWGGAGLTALGDKGLAQWDKNREIMKRKWGHA